MAEHLTAESHPYLSFGNTKMRTVLADRRSSPFIRSRRRKVIDRRNTVRTSFSTMALLYKSSKMMIAARLRNVSDSGACLELHQQSSLECDFQISIPLLRNLKIDCERVWSRGTHEDGAELIGVRFVGMDKSERLEVRKRILLDDALLMSYAQGVTQKTDDFNKQQEIKSFFLIDLRKTIEELIELDYQAGNGADDRTIVERSRAILASLDESARTLNDTLQNMVLVRTAHYRVRFLLARLLYQSAAIRSILEKSPFSSGCYHIIEMLYDEKSPSDEHENISWEEHYQLYCNPVTTTRLLQKNVPLLEFSGWRVEDIREGYCQSIVPFESKAVNQHTSHQSSVYCLAGDYTGGIALYSLLRGMPTFGVHPADAVWGLNLWLLKTDLKFIRPSTSDLKIYARIHEQRFERIIDQFYKRRRHIEKVSIELRNEDDVVGTGTMTYFLQMLSYPQWLKMSSGTKALTASYSGAA